HRLTAFLRLLWLFPVTALAGWAGEALFGASGTPVLPSNPILCLLTQAALPALAEETFFRGVLLKGLTEIRGTKTAVFCSALAFALFHSDPAGIIRAFFAGLILGWGASVSSSFLPVLFHFAYNAGVLLTDNRWMIPAASLLLFLLLLPFLLGKVRKNDGRY
ncbi:MAG: CPBP family intramembrane metalloprotease, partial [Clostridia bacterium]|nr:CPBP family intramembrane metalloprotease [Clostridia bacterium]